MSLLTCSGVLAQSLNITGKVTERNGDPLPGVSIAVMNTSTGTVTDIDGNYRITVEDGNNTLVFSYIGFSKPGSRDQWSFFN